MANHFRKNPMNSVNSLLFTAPKGGGTLSHAGVHGEAPGSIKSQKEQEENISKSHYCGFPRKERMRQGKQT